MQDSDFFSDLRLEDKTIVFADVVGSVSLLEENEILSITRIRRLVASLVSDVLVQFDGRLIERVGDGILVEFENPLKATKCAFAMHNTAYSLSQKERTISVLELRIGIHRADIFSTENEVYGRGVNLAARLATMASPGQTIGTATVVESLVPEIDASIEDLGEYHLKHIKAPVRAYKLDALSARIHDRIGALKNSVAFSSRQAQQIIPVLAVLPFTSYTKIEGSNSQAFLGDIVTDRVIDSLSRSSALTIISRLSTMIFKDRGSTIAEIKGALNVDFIVSGKFYISGPHLTISAELSDAATEKVIWTKSITDSIESATMVDSDLITDLVTSIAESIFAAEVRAVRETPLPNVASHALLLSAISLLYRQSHSDFDRARQALTVLNERVPRHPSPLAWLARWHLFKMSQGWSTNRKEDGNLALQYANKALDLDPASSLALTMLGHVQTNYLVDFDAAEETLSEAISINPNESLAWLQRGNARSFQGDGQLAMEYTIRANELSPLDPSRHFYLSILGSTALTAGNYEKAIEAAKGALRLNLMHASSIRVLAIAQSLTGQIEQAKQTVKRLVKIDPDLTVTSYIENSPGKASGLAEKFGLALQAAGLPVNH